MALAPGMYLGTGDTGIAFNSTDDNVFPRNPSTNLPRDNAIDLGSSSARFKNLYLSGSAYTPVVQGLGDEAGLTFGGALVAPRKNNAAANGTVDLGASSARFKDLYLSGGVYLGGTGSANKLDDYEEGTWTASSAQLTITSQDCVYEKVGNLVHVSGYIVVSASSSSVISISNLIFSAAENSSLSVGVSGKTTSFERIDDGGSIATFGIDSNITSSTEIYFSASYRTS